MGDVGEGDVGPKSSIPCLCDVLLTFSATLGTLTRYRQKPTTEVEHVEH